jgi:hypothetical protein
MFTIKKRNLLNLISESSNYVSDIYTEEKLRRVNKIIKDMVFTFEGQLSIGLDWKAKFDYQFQIKGVRQMISVGELYDYLMVDVTIIDGDKMFLVSAKLMGSSITNEYRLKNNLSTSISEELQYFFGSDYVRVTLDKDKSSIKLSDELKEKIDNFIFER